MTTKLTNAPAPDPRGQHGTVYLIHFDRPYRHARHYIGWASDLDARLAVHRRGAGSPLIRAVQNAGISWRLARCWDADRYFERRLKSWHKSRALCPLCTLELPNRKHAARPVSGVSTSPSICRVADQHAANRLTEEAEWQPPTSTALSSRAT